MSSAGDMSSSTFTRFRVKLTLPELQHLRGDKAGMRAGLVRDQIQSFLDACHQYDKHCALMPWSLQEAGLPLKFGRSTDGAMQPPLPTHPDQAKKYFHSINYYSNHYEMYFYIRMRHECTRESLLDNVVRSHQLSLWIASLQNAEDPVKGGFFVYSHRAFATSKQLLFAMQHTISTMAGKEIDIALYWGLVNMAKAKINGDSFLQIEVDSTDYDLLKSSLTHIYNINKLYPLGVPLVYVPPVARCIDLNLLTAACMSQGKFARTSSVLEFRCFLRNLDHPVTVKETTSGLGTTTLRTVFRCAINIVGQPVFHSTLECNDRRGEYIQVIVMPPPKREKLAQVIVQSPVAYFRHLFEETELQYMFDKPSLLAGKSETYDPETYTVTSSYEALASQALGSFFHVDMQLMLDELDKAATMAETQTDSESFGTSFSFNPGSVRTASAWRKKQKTSFQVPGTSHEATGEAK